MVRFGGLLAFALFASACSMPMPPSENDENRAFQVVWEGVYQMPFDLRPTVHFVDSNCTDEYGNEGIRLFDGTCREGFTGDDCYVMTTHKLSWGAFAHELYHKVRFDLTGDLDVNHTGSGWETLVPEAVNQLEKAGL